MPKKQTSNVDAWLRRETPRTRRALAGTTQAKERETKEYVEKVLRYEAEFAVKSPADKSKKQKKPRQKQARCTEGRWRTIDDRPVFICA